MIMPALCSIAGAQSAIPNYILSTTYFDKSLADPSAGRQAVSAGFSDGLGRSIQSQVYGLNSSTATPDSCLIAVSYFDEAGRPSMMMKPFGYKYNTPPTSANPVFDNSSWDALKNLAKAYLVAIGSPAGEYPYSETRFSNDPLSRTLSQAAPGLKFSFDAQNGHYSRIWYYGINSKDPLLPAALADTTKLTNGQALGTQTNPNYFLTVAMDPNGNFSQEITDIFGKKVTSWTNGGKTGENDEIKSTYEYDILGNLTKETPPVGNAGIPDLEPSTYQYNTLGQLIQKYTPDAKTVAYKYDLQGRMIAAQDERQRSISQGADYTATIYDAFGRILAVGNATGFANLKADKPPHLKDLVSIKIRNFYDNAAAIAELGLPADVTSSLINLRGRLVAAICYDNSGSYSANHRVAEIFSYNADGRDSIKFKIIPSLGIQKFTYDYDLQGNLLVEKYRDDIVKNSGKNSATHYYEYNALGQLVAVRSGSSVSSPLLMKFEYDRAGRMTKKTMYKGDGTTAIASTANSYNVRDWPALIAANSANQVRGYTETINYDDAAAPQFNGNISRTINSYFAEALYGQPNTFAHNYTYDKANRLTSADNPGDNQYDEAFSYYRDGRLKRKVQGSTSDASGTIYDYNSGTSRLKNQPIKGQIDNFIFDPNGNMVLDKSKKMTIEYDWRDMPILFRFYSSIPGNLTWTNLGSIDPGLLVSQVAMMYDAAGNRVLKTEFNKSTN